MRRSLTLAAGFLAGLVFGQQSATVLNRALEAARAGRTREALDLLRSAPPADSESAGYYHLRGTLEARTGQLESAEKDLERALAVEPASADALYTLGLVKLERDKPADALSLLAQSVKRNSGRPEAWLALGQAHLQLKDQAAADRSLETAARLAPDSIAIHFGIGTAYAGQGQFGKAATAFERAVSLNPSGPAAEIALVRSLLKSGRTGSARERVEELGRKRARDPVWHTEVGIALAESHLYRQAIAEFQAALALGLGLENRNSFDAAYNLALAYYYEGLHEECEATLEQILGRKPDEQGYHLLGLVYEETSQPGKAALQFEQALKLNPRVADYSIHLGRLALLSANYSEAEQRFLEASKRCRAGQCFHAWIGLGTAYKLEAKFPLARAAFKEAIREQPRNAIGHAYLGEAFLRANDYDAARAALAKAIEVEPGSSLAHYMYAHALLKSDPGVSVDAISHLREAIRLDPSSALAYYRLGMLHSRAAEYDHAAPLLEKAVALNPDLKGAHYQLALTYRKLGKSDAAKREFARVRSLSVAAEDDDAGLVIEFGRLSRHKPATFGQSGSTR